MNFRIGDTAKYRVQRNGGRTKTFETTVEILGVAGDTIVSPIGIKSGSVLVKIKDSEPTWVNVKSLKLSTD